MKRLLLVILFFSGAVWCSGQSAKKALDLNTAVLQQYGSLAAEDLSGFTWIAQTDQFSHLSKDGTSLLLRNTKGETYDSIGVKFISDLLELEGVKPLRSLSVISWLDKNTFVFAHNKSYYSFSKDARKLSLLAVVPIEGENAEFHPASGRVAFTMGQNVYEVKGKSPVAVTTHTDSEVLAGVAIHRSEFGITKGLFWSPSGKKLGFYEMDESPVTNYPLADYTQIPALAKPLKYPMAGQASHHARVGIYDVDSRKMVYLDTEGPKDQYLTNLTFSPDDKIAYLAVINRDQNDMKLNAYNASSGKLIKTLFTETHPSYVEPESPVLFMDGLDDRFLWLSERDGYNHLYLYNTDGTLIRQLTSGSFDVVDVVGFSSKGKEVVVLATDGLMNRVVYVVNTASAKKSRLTPLQGFYSASMANGGNMVLLKQKSATLANRVYLAKASGKEGVTLLEASNPLEEYEIGEVEYPVLIGADGIELQARVIKPYNFDPEKKYPVIVYLYGGSHLQLVTGTFGGGAALWMFHAANRGYIVFSVDGRGSSGRGLAFEQATFRQLGQAEMADQLTGVEYLKSLPYVDFDRMAVHGWSFGGFLSTSLMLHHPGVFQVGVAGGTVTDWRMYEVMYTERYMDTPEQNPEGYAQSDLKNYVDNLEGKLLLIHGLDDDVVVPQHAFTLIKAFVDAGKQLDFFVYPGHAHNVRGKDRVHLIEKVLGYIDLHLKND